MPSRTWRGPCARQSCPHAALSRLGGGTDQPALDPRTAPERMHKVMVVAANGSEAWQWVGDIVNRLGETALNLGQHTSTIKIDQQQIAGQSRHKANSKPQSSYSMYNQALAAYDLAFGPERFVW